jgi:hypothetical protein
MFPQGSSDSSNRPRDGGAAKSNRRRAFELLAYCRNDCSETIMLAHGFTVERRSVLLGRDKNATSVGGLGLAACSARSKQVPKVHLVI